MPILRGQDSESCWYRWGSQGVKYRYSCGDEEAAKRAKKKAIEQAIAADAGANEYSMVDLLKYLNKTNDDNK